MFLFTLICIGFINVRLGYFNMIHATGKKPLPVLSRDNTEKPYKLL